MIIAGTGHRPSKLGGYDNKNVEDLLATLLHGAIVHYRPTKIITGMALGYDILLAEAAIACKVPFEAAIPFEGQESKWPLAAKQRYNRVLWHADKVTFCSEPGYATYKMHVRNQYMVDNCDAVLALWDGSEGGTGSCVKYAYSKQKPVANFWEIYNECRIQHMAALAARASAI